MCFINCRFVFFFWIILQTKGIVVNDSRIQVLLLNSSFSVGKLVFRHKTSIGKDEVPTPGSCKEQITKWFNDLNQLKQGKCEKSEECLDALDQLDAFVRYPAPGSPNINDGSFEKCNELNKKENRHRRKYCYLIQSNENVNCREEYHSVLFHENRTAFGICGPENCHGKDFASMFGGMKKPFHFMMDRPVCAVFCTVRDIPKKNMFYVFTSFLILLVSIVFFSSLYDYIRDTRYRLSSESEKVFGQRAILSWSLWSNIEFLFKDSPGYIKCLDCLRSITFTWVVGQNVVGHLAFYDADLRVKSSEISIASSALSSLIPIYTYLFISGLTVSYTFIRAKPSIEVLKRPITWLVFYFHRWIRYIKRALLHCITIVDVLSSSLAFVHISGAHIFDDILLLYCNRYRNSYSCVTSWFYIHGLLLLQASRQDDKLVEIILAKPWNQLAPYMLGMIVGCFLAKHSGSRRIIHPVASSIIWIVVSVLGACALIFGNQGTTFVEKATANVLTRAVWSLCLIWIIVSTQMKWAGPIGHFLEHPFWRPFGKLSYCAFIVHHMALYFLFNMEEHAPRYVSFWHEYFHYTVPIVIYSYFVAFFLSLIVEVPMIRLDKMILDKCIPASKIEEKKDFDDDDSDFEKSVERSSSEKSKEMSISDKSEKIKERSEERNIEDQKDDMERSREDYSMDEPLLEREYY
ncbi:Protein CBG27179 [Caenorhabditis briggsae]|uniref:Protein CBG27179 n=1 Tax=Caenorhabditis briggsae TaxID=6238 RepID=B6IL89_CAEBR|nr:Protein CBG27179 [Caenorhabditis briggsae]CAS00642.1 Protein CBG27179 [Caenorhabditis briggsae]